MRTKNMKEIIIEGPEFYGQEDENIFFHCIYNLPNFSEVKGAGTQLTIQFTSVVTEIAQQQNGFKKHEW